MKFPELFEPINIGKMTLRNRLMTTAMGTNLGDDDGFMTQASVDYYAERAKGGFGLITLEVTAVSPEGKSIPREPGLWHDDQIESYRRVIDECHKYGAKVSVQLHHAGRETIADHIYGLQPVGATAEPCPMYRELPHELTIDEIYKLIEKYGDAGRRAMEAGADMIEIHGAHSYLVEQFISECSNHRIDEFGGNFENRMRFPKLIFENIKGKIRNDIPICFRVNGEEPIPGGNSKYDAAAVARYMEECGVDAINVSYGTTSGAFYWLIAPAAVRAGYQLYSAEEIKKVVSIPVMNTGRFTEPYVAANALKAGKVDIIAMGRQSLADPHWPNKVASGRVDELNICIGCAIGCTGELNLGHHVSCLVNPFTGREGETRIIKAEEPKKIMVVGAGPAGLMASMICAERGHSVTLYEKSGYIGGQFRIASKPPTKASIGATLGNYATIAKRRGVKFEMNTEVTPELVADEKPDAVILCTGGKPIVPNIEGLTLSENKSNAAQYGSKLKFGQQAKLGAGAEEAKMTVFQSHEVLDGKHMLGQNVLVIGGGSVGVETADYIAQSYRDVTIIEMQDEVALDEQPAPRVFLMERLAKNNVKMITGATVKKFTDVGVVYTDKSGAEHEIKDIDTAVLAVGTKAYNPLEESIKDLVKEVYVVGDAIKGRKAYDAIREAADVALKV